LNLRQQPAWAFCSHRGTVSIVESSTFCPTPDGTLTCSPLKTGACAHRRGYRWQCMLRVTPFTLRSAPSIMIGMGTSPTRLGASRSLSQQVTRRVPRRSGPRPRRQTAQRRSTAQAPRFCGEDPATTRGSETQHTRVYHSRALGFVSCKRRAGPPPKSGRYAAYGLNPAYVAAKGNDQTDLIPYPLNTLGTAVILTAQAPARCWRSTSF
jgi:hypothetical protein